MTHSEKEVRRTVARRVHEIANASDWAHLNITERKAFYEKWTADNNIGGMLRQIMPASRIRVYLKDTIIRDYTRALRPSLEGMLKNKNIDCGATKQFNKPKAILCDKKALYTLAAALEWKGALLSAFERAHEARALEINKVFFIQHSRDRFVDSSYRAMIEDAARKLGISIEWVR